MQTESTQQAAGSAELRVTPGSTLQPNHQPEPNGYEPKAAEPEPNREAFWRSVMQRRLQSGLNIREFCRREQLSESAYHHWKRKFTQRDGQPINGKSKKKTASQQNSKSKPTFIPVALDPVAMHQPQVEIRYADGTIVRIAAGCDEATISIILKAMGNGAC